VRVGVLVVGEDPSYFLFAYLIVGGSLVVPNCISRGVAFHLN
jgi:hypothetical protein